MKVILLQDVPNVGKRMDVKDVSDGHALNMLIPNKLAKSASGAALKQLETEKAKMAAELKIREDLLKKNIKDIEDIKIVAVEKANDKGHLFAGIHKDEIAKLIKDQTHLDVLPEWIMLDEPLKQVGEFELKISIHDKSAKFKLEVRAA